jgi:hypothetical protein
MVFNNDESVGSSVCFESLHRLTRRSTRWIALKLLSFDGLGHDVPTDGRGLGLPLVQASAGDGGPCPSADRQQCDAADRPELDRGIAQESGKGPTLTAQLLNTDTGRWAEGIPHKLPMGTDHNATLAAGADPMPILSPQQCGGGIATERAAGRWIKNFSAHVRPVRSIPCHRLVHSSGVDWAIVQRGRQKFGWPGSGTFPLGSTEKPGLMACREAAASRKMKCKSQNLIFLKMISTRNIANVC